MIKDSQNVLSRKSKSCLSIILNRPEVINSLSEAMIDNIEGIGARLVERNYKPKWVPNSLSKVDLTKFIP